MKVGPSRVLALAATLALALVLANPAHAAEPESPSAPPAPVTYSGLFGYHHPDVAAFGGAAAWPIRSWEATLAPWRLEPSLMLEVSRWDGRGHGSDDTFLWDVGLIPMFRWRREANDAFFLAGGVGAHLLSETSINRSRYFGSTFQFGERGEVGVSFGATRRYEAALYIEHVSNAKLAEPNDGITLLGVRLGMRID